MESVPVSFLTPVTAPAMPAFKGGTTPWVTVSYQERKKGPREERGRLHVLADQALSVWYLGKLA